jgi:hypothetical protein
MRFGAALLSLALAVAGTAAAQERQLYVIDGIGQDFGALAQKEGAAYADLSKRGGATTDHVRESIVSLAPELSYTSATPRLKPEEAKYFHFDIYYVMPGRETDADALAKEFVALFKAKNMPNGYRLFKSEPRGTPENRPLVDGSKPATTGRVRDRWLRV